MLVHFVQSFSYLHHPFGSAGEKCGLVHVHVKEDHIDDFIEACRRNHEASVQEPGNRRFDILQSNDDPSRFVLYEAYDDAESAAAHKQTAHYLRWRETVADWMAEPRQGIGYRGLYPA